MYTTIGMFRKGAGGVVEPPIEEYPTLALRRHNAASVAVTSRHVDLPAGISAGQLIVLIISIEAPGSIVDPPADYTLVSGTVYYKIADGSESAAVTFVVSSTGAFSNHGSMVFNGATKVAAAAFAATAANANPPELTVPWGVAKNLFMVIDHGVAAGNSLINFPSNCPLYRTEDTSGIDEYSAGANVEAATFNPDPFETASVQYRATTLGIGA